MSSGSEQALISSPETEVKRTLAAKRNSVFFEFAAELARVHGAKRTSLIVDPDDGRIPYIATEEQQRATRVPERFDSVKDRPLTERCLHLFLTGPPIRPVTTYMGHQIVQTADYVMIMAEYLHEVRVVRLGAQHLPSAVRQWLGDSIGHWEENTLVVDTTNFTTETKFMGASENLHVVERFKPIDGNTFLYRATVEDPCPCFPNNSRRSSVRFLPSLAPLAKRPTLLRGRIFPMALDLTLLSK